MGRIPTRRISAILHRNAGCQNTLRFFFQRNFKSGYCTFTSGRITVTDITTAYSYFTRTSKRFFPNCRRKCFAYYGYCCSTGRWKHCKHWSAKNRIFLSRTTQCMLFGWSFAPAIQTCQKWTEKEIQLSGYKKRVYHCFYRKKFRRDETAQAGLCPPFLSKVRYRTSYGASAGIRFHPTWHLSGNPSQ